MLVYTKHRDGAVSEEIVRWMLLRNRGAGCLPEVWWHLSPLAISPIRRLVCHAMIKILGGVVSLVLPTATEYRCWQELTSDHP